MVLFFLYFCLEENLRFFSYYSVLLNTLSESTIHMNVYKYKHLHLVVALSLPMKSEVDYPYSRLQKDLKNILSYIHCLQKRVSKKWLSWPVAHCTSNQSIGQQLLLFSIFYTYLYKKQSLEILKLEYFLNKIVSDHKLEINVQ